MPRHLTLATDTTEATEDPQSGPGVEAVAPGVVVLNVTERETALSPIEAQLLASMLVNAATLAESIERHPSNRG